MLVGALSGGGNGASGNVNLTTGQTTTISTGLSSVKRFVIFQVFWDGTYYWFSTSVYDADKNGTYYGGQQFNGINSFTGGKNALGTAVDSTRCVTINSISNGDISITAPSLSNYIGTFTWYAECNKSEIT